MSGILDRVLGRIFQWAGDTTSGAAYVAEQGNIAGLRNPSSLTNAYGVAFEDWNITVVDLSADSTIVTSGPARLGGVYVNTVLSAHACPIKDDTVTKFSLVASLAAGVFVPIKGRFETSLIVDPNDAATGEIAVLWRPL